MSSRPLLAASFAAIYLIWGSTYLAIHYVVAGMTPFFAMGSRFLTAGLLLGGWAMARGAKLPRKAHWKGTILLGTLFFGGGNGAVAWAEAHGLATGTAAILVATMPLFVALLRALEGRKPRLQSWFGLLLGFVGCVSLAQPDGSFAFDRNALIVLAGAFAWALGSVLAPRLATADDGRMAAASQMTVGGLSLAGLGLLQGEAMPLVSTIPTSSWLAWAYLVVPGSIVGFSAYRYLLTQVPTERVATYAYVNPAVAILLGLLIGEQPDESTVMAMVAILAGVVLCVSPTIPLSRGHWRRRLGWAALE